MTPTMIANPIKSNTANLAFPPDTRIARPSCGRREITLVKMRIDMPLPIPRCVMSSPIHMIMAVPAALPLPRALQDLDAPPRPGHGGPEPVDRDDEQREEDLVPEVRDLERVDEGAEHEVSILPRHPTSSAEPPACSIFAFAARLNACARTVSLLSSSPRARILTGRPLCARPWAYSTAGSTSPAKDRARVSTFTTAYSTRLGLVKPFSLGTRRWNGIWPPSNPGLGLWGAAQPLVA